MKILLISLVTFREQPVDVRMSGLAGQHGKASGCKTICILFACSQCRSPSRVTLLQTLLSSHKSWHTNQDVLPNTVPAHALKYRPSSQNLRVRPSELKIQNAYKSQFFKTFFLSSSTFPVVAGKHMQNQLPPPPALCSTALSIRPQCVIYSSSEAFETFQQLPTAAGP